MAGLGWPAEVPAGPQHAGGHLPGRPVPAEHLERPPASGRGSGPGRRIPAATQRLRRSARCPPLAGPH